MKVYRAMSAMIAAATMLSPALNLAHAADDNENADDNYDQPLRFMKAKLKQLYPKRPAVIVTSSDGETFTDSRLRLGNRSPWRMQVSYECPGAGYTPNGNYMLALSQLKQLRYDGGWIQELEETQGLLDSNSGEVDVFYWDETSEFLQQEISEIAVNACNNKARQIRQANPGMGPKTAMSKVGKIYPFRSGDRRFMTGVAARLEGKCLAGRYEQSAENPGVYDNFSGWEAADTGDLFLSLELPVNCSAKVTPPEPAATSFTTGFSITAIALEAEPKLVAGVCPRTVKFRGRISGQGSGTVRYRIRGSDGSLSPIRVARVRSGLEPADINFERAFGEDSSGGLITPPVDEPETPPLGLRVQGGNPDPSGPVFETTAPPPPGPVTPGATDLATPVAEGEHSGWYRIEVVSPTNGKKQSTEANYKVVCKKPTPGLSAPTPSEPPASRPIRRNN